MRRHNRFLVAGSAVFASAAAVAPLTHVEAAPMRADAATTRASAATTRASAERTFRVRPKEVRAGERVRASGRRWPRRARVHLLVGPPNSEASHVAWARTNRRGRFRKSVRIAAGTAPGTWVMLACRRQCAVKRLARFRVAP